jgi:hypothetical protein
MKLLSLILAPAMLTMASQPVKLKWLYVSASSIWERWESGGLTWTKSDFYPENLNYLNTGGQLAIGRKLYTTLGFSVFYNRVESFSNLEEQVVKTNSGYRSVGLVRYSRPAVQTFGLGDIKLGVMTSLKPFKHGINVWIPSGYKSKERIFHHAHGTLPQVGFHLARPWTGFGVYRIGYALSLSGRGQYLAFFPSIVVFKPGGARLGMVEKGDFSLNGAYAATVPLTNKLRLKPKLDAGYGRYHWEGKDRKPRKDLSIQPGMGLSFSPHWSREIAVSLAVTAYGYSNDKGEVIDSPRKITLGLYYGLYR